jgi:predicted DNA-binding transcriptional regulator YafY
MPTTAVRLITLIQLLQLKPGQKAAALAEELGVSVRTLHRYFSMLDEMGIPVYSERGPYGGFSLVRGYKLPPLVFTPEEAAAISLGAGLVEELWGQLYREAARGALAKLKNVLPDEQRQEIAWARRSLFATGMHRADLAAQAPALEKLRQALREHRRVHLVYQNASQPAPVHRDLDPFALVHRWGWWYVVGYCHLRQAVRLFRVDRIAGLSLRRTSAARNFDLRAYLERESLPQPQVIARLRFAPEARGVLLESQPYWDTIEKQQDGATMVTFRAPTLEWAASTTLAYGPLVEVLDPPELRQMVAGWASAVAAKYNRESNLEGGHDGKA